MFPDRYFADRYFPNRYFPIGEETVAAAVPPLAAVGRVVTGPAARAGLAYRPRSAAGRARTPQSTGRLD